MTFAEYRERLLERWEELDVVPSEEIARIYVEALGGLWDYECGVSVTGAR